LLSFTIAKNKNKRAPFIDPPVSQEIGESENGARKYC